MNKNLFQSIYFKLMLFCLVTLIPFYLLGLFFNDMALSQIKEKNIEMMEIQVDTLLSQIDDEINKILRLQRMYMDRDLNLLKLSSRNKYLSKYEVGTYINGLINQLTIMHDSSNIIDEAIVYIPEFDVILSSKRNYVDNISDEEKQFYLENDFNNYFELDKEKNINICLEYPQFVEDPLYYINVKLSSKNLRKLFLNGHPNGETLLIVNDEKFVYNIKGDNSAEKIIASIEERIQIDQQNQWAEDNFKIGDNTYFVVGQTIRTPSVTIITLTKSSIILGTFIRLRALLWLLIGMSLLLIIIYLIYIYRIVEQPLILIGKLFEQVQTGNFVLRYEYKKKDEFGRIFKGFEKMVRKLELLIQQLYLNKISMQQAELKQLQLQINPHFLYNSFNLLRRSIRLEDTETAETMSKYLGQYFRYITKNEMDYVPISFEYEHANVYASIQSIRFGNRINVIFDKLEDYIGNMIVPRLFLQPIIENSFNHGLHDKIDNGLIHIGFEESDEYLVIFVEDNGIGIDEQKLEDMKKSLKEQKASDLTMGSGLLNTHKRLLIKFGESYGISIDNMKDQGVLVQIKIPKPDNNS